MEFESFVLAASVDDLAAEPAARAHADAVEFRMDLADAPLAALDAYAGALPVIATNRAASEGGGAPEDGDRLDALRTAAELPAVAAVDVELATFDDEDERSGREGGARVVEHARANDTVAIVSAHDFEGTPPRATLCGTLTRASERGDVGKLAVTASAPADVLDLLAATHALAAEGRRVATMAMGAAGRHSRAIAPLYGSRIGYAPIDPDAATAPGQYDLATLADLIERLR
jgi:3-dehydroquinate dehydratase-1